ncbi:hypothetical protein GF324_05385 [bacterium]|nr:hypothetical protein [bacterium]
MKRYQNILFVCGLAAFISFAAFAGAQFKSFTADSRDGHAVLKWETTTEVNVERFAVERSSDGQEFHEIATFPPHGANVEYRYIDTSIFKQTVRSYHYRIRCDDAQGHSQYSETRRVHVVVSGIQQTWGSIKALFR